MCPEHEELVALVSGELPADRISALEQHLAGCPACSERRSQLQAMLHGLAADSGEFSDPKLAGDVLGRLAEARPARAPWLLGFRFLPVVAAACLLLIAGFSVWWGTRGDGGFTARGGAEDPDRWVSIAIYRAGAGGIAPLGDTIAPGQALAFRYTNHAPAGFRFLVIFAVDSAGRVYWYYPGWIEPTEHPQSIPIRPGAADVVLPDQIRHPLAEGPLEVIAVFSREPLQVEAVEAQLAKDLAAAKDLAHLGRLGLPDTGQHLIRLRVAGSGGAP